MDLDERLERIEKLLSSTAIAIQSITVIMVTHSDNYSKDRKIDLIKKSSECVKRIMDICGDDPSDFDDVIKNAMEPHHE